MYMKLSTIYLLKNKFPLHIVFIIGEYESTSYKKIKQNVIQNEILDETIFIHPIMNYLDSFVQLVTYLQKHHNFQRYNLDIILSKLNKNQSRLYDKLYGNESYTFDSYNITMLEPCRELIFNSIKHLKYI